MGGDAAADVPPAAAAAALSEPPSLESLAPELLSRVLDGPELLAAAGASRALRATLGDPRHDALKPRWAALALQLADPAASLALAERDARRSRADTPPAPTLLSAEEVTQVRVQDMWKKLQRVDRRSGWNIIVYDKPPPQRGPVGAWPAQVADSATSAGDAAWPPLPPSTHAAEATATLARHAARLGSWPALLHALCSRNCIACGVVTRLMAWGPSNDEAACPSRGPARCCSDCALPGLRAGEQRSVALINTPFFDSSDAPPPAPVDATTFALRSRRNSACHDALAAAVNACPEGGTVDVSGMADWPHEAMVSPGRAAIRLRGVPPPSRAYRPVHTLCRVDDDDDESRCIAAELPPSDAHAGADSVASADCMPQLVKPRRKLMALEAAAARDVGCPSARLVARTPYAALDVASAPLMLGSLCVSSGEHFECGKLGFPHMVGDEMLYAGGIVDGLAVRGEAAAACSAPLLLRCCWLTAYSGSGLVLDAGAHAGVERCVLSNCLGAAVACNTGATLRMRHCHVISNNLDMCAGPEADYDALVSGDLHNATNVFVANLPTPGTIDKWPFPTERQHFPPSTFVPPPERELAPWSPAFTIGPVHHLFEQERRPPVPPAAFARVVDVALLA